MSGINRIEASVSELERQKYFAAKVSTLYDKQMEVKKRKMYISTFGCQMNARDSEKIEGMLESMGFEKADKENEADFIIYNTCCVRENAENKVYGNLGILKNIKKKRPWLKIALCGCMMQQEEVVETLRNKYKFVDIVFGTFNLYKLPELMYTNLETGAPVFDIWKESSEVLEDLPSIRKYKFKASVNIMYGCDNFCSYCIVPYVRGRERSRASADILSEVHRLAGDGVREIMLLGQNVNSYGKGLTEKITFAQLLKKTAEIDGIERIRFMTSHPKDLSDELIYTIRDIKKICRHIHLPFQAGNNGILKKMNRKYTKEYYIELVQKIKSEIPDIAITTDILVGFPGEGDEEILDTLDIIQKCSFSGAFTFLYSKRTGTPAASMPNQISTEDAKRHFNAVIEELNPIIYGINNAKIGNVYKVMPEEVSAHDVNMLSGRLDDNSLVHFKADKKYIGEIVDVKIVDCKTFYLSGEMC